MAGAGPHWRYAGRCARAWSFGPPLPRAPPELQPRRSSVAVKTQAHSTTRRYRAPRAHAAASGGFAGTSTSAMGLSPGRPSRQEAEKDHGGRGDLVEFQAGGDDVAPLRSPRRHPCKGGRCASLPGGRNHRGAQRPRPPVSSRVRGLDLASPLGLPIVLLPLQLCLLPHQSPLFCALGAAPLLLHHPLVEAGPRTRPREPPSSPPDR